METSFSILGIHNVKMKAQAALTRSFLETACHPDFIHSLYHTVLFRYHVLEDNSVPDPGFPPFYPKEFFAKIREVHEESPLNVATMSEKQWYTLLLEDSCTMQVGEGGMRQFISSRVESASPGTDWETSWRLARLGGLGPENTSFLFKLLHQILPTQERLHRAKKEANPRCKAPGCTSGDVGDLQHSLVQCEANQLVGKKLMETLSQYQPTISTEAALRLEFSVEDDLELPLVWITAATLLSIWEQRKVGSKVQPYLTRAQLEAKVNILRDTRLSKITSFLDNMIKNMFEK